MSDRNSFAKRLTSLERHLDTLEARKVAFPKRRDTTDEEIIEVGLILLADAFEGDEQVFAEYLVKHFGFSVEEAAEIARGFGRMLEDRRKLASDPAQQHA